MLPAVRGALSAEERVILHYDGGDDVLATLAGERAPELTARGMATPEHLLRAGRLPVWLELDLAASADALVAQARSGLAAARADYEQYHRRHAAPDERPLGDWAKIVLIPGLGLVSAFSDKRSAVTANLCYRATLEAIEGAEAVDRFQFIPERDVFEFEHWPLERRKVEETIARERAGKELPRHVVVVIGGGSGIGRAAARQFAEQGAHVVVADLDGATAEGVAGELAAELPGRAIGAAVDVRDDASLDALFRRTVLEFGGLDCLFYTAGLPPRFAPLTDDPARGSPAAARGALPGRRGRDRPRRYNNEAARRRRLDRGLGVQGGRGPGQGGGGLRRQQGGAAAGAPGGGGRARTGRDPGQRHQRRPGGHAALPPVRPRAGGEPRDQRGRAAGGRTGSGTSWASG